MKLNETEVEEIVVFDKDTNDVIAVFFQDGKDLKVIVSNDVTYAVNGVDEYGNALEDKDYKLK